MALKNLYARLVLRLIGPSLRLAAREQGAAKSIGWTLGKDGRLSIIQTEQQAASVDLDMTTLISASVRQVIASERLQGGVLWRIKNGAPDRKPLNSRTVVANLRFRAPPFACNRDRVHVESERFFKTAAESFVPWKLCSPSEDQMTK